MRCDFIKLSSDSINLLARLSRYFSKLIKTALFFKGVIKTLKYKFLNIETLFIYKIFRLLELILFQKRMNFR